MDVIELKDLDVLKLKSGDTVIFRMKERNIEEAYLKMFRQIRGILLERGIESIFATDDVEISVLRKEDEDGR